MENSSKQRGSTLCRVLKICIGMALIALGALVVEGPVGVILIVIGALVLIFGLIGYCPCSALGKTCCCSSKRTQGENSCR